MGWMDDIIIIINIYIYIFFFYNVSIAFNTFVHIWLVDFICNKCTRANEFNFPPLFKGTLNCVDY